MAFPSEVSWCRRLSAAIVFLVALVLPATSFADVSAANQYKRALSKARDIVPSTEFGDRISPRDGALSFKNVDLELEGTGPTIRVIRSASVQRGNTMEFTSGNRFGKWELEIPRIKTVTADPEPTIRFRPVTPSSPHGWQVPGSDPNARCTNMDTPNDVTYDGSSVEFFSYEWWFGYQLVGDDGESREIFKRNGGINPNRGANGTKDNWVIECLPSTANGQPGEGFLVIAPDGTKYWMNWLVYQPYELLNVAFDDMPPKGYTLVFGLPRKAASMLVTRIEDRFGNYLTFSYSGDRLTSITASDGRQVQFGQSGSITSVTAVGAPANRTWTYTYGDANQDRLDTVTQPDGSTWSYTGDFGHQLFDTFHFNGCDQNAISLTPSPRSISGKSPSGATATFNIEEHIFGRSYEMRSCSQSNSMLDPQGAPFSPKRYVGVAVTGRTVTGPGMETQSSIYTYGPENASWTHECATPTSCPSTVWSLETRNDGANILRTYSNRADQTENLLLSEQVIQGGITKRITNLTYATATYPGSNPYPWPLLLGDAYQPFANFQTTARWTPVKTTTITQDGATFTRDVATFDSLARPLSVQRFSQGTTSDRSRTDATAYHDNTALWALGQTASVTNVNTGTVLQQTEYNAQAMPWKQYQFGKLETTTLYHGDGNPSAISDGNGNTTTLNNWKRGLPQSIGFPATAEAPSGSTISAVVNDHGWITQKTDENGFTENYQHDAMGRTSRVDYPSGDLTAWAPTLINFQQINGSEYGIGAGHWKRTQTTGNRTDITYYDGLWRPLVSETFDAVNPTATRSISVKRYDAQGRTSFESKPVASISAYTDSLGGITSQHDAIDRLTQTVESSELGNLTTSVEYLTGLQTKITNPRGAITQTAFTAWDEPTDSMPVSIQLPEGRVTDLSRDALGDVTVIKRRNAANTQSLERKFVRDAHRRICKQIDPESGSTVRDFDNANNVIWQASGLNLPSTAGCDTASAYSSGRRIDVTWDARNRETQRNFPDGRGNTATTYYPDNLVHSKITYNDAGNGAPVVSTQTYDKRRFLRSDESTQPGWYAWGSNLAYDVIGNVSSRSYPNGLVVSFNPNALGHPTLVQASDGQTLASNISMYPNGALQSFTYGNGIVHTMLQNARQLPSRSTDVGVIDFTFGYDPTRNPTEILDQLRGAHYSRWMQYDFADRLTDAGSCSFGGDCWHRNTYDVFDNIKSWKLPGVRDYADYQYSARNLPEQIKDSANATVVSQSFDPQGNLSYKNGQGYTFDFGNRLREVVGKQWSRYDGHGHRVLRWEASEPGILSLYSIDNQLLYDDNNRASSRTSHLFVYLQGSLLATKERNLDTGNERWTFQHTDALGSPVAITDTSGTVIERTDYEPWGNAIGKPNMDTVGFTGHQMDGSTQLIHMQQRYYDPNTAQFLSIDPVNVEIRTGNNFNRRRYAANNPYKFTDPDGRELVVVGDRADRQYIENQIRELSETRTGRQLLRDLRATPEVIIIRTTKNSSGNETTPHDWNKAKSGLPVGSTVTLDPSATLGGKDVTGSNERPNVVGTAHDLKHGLDFALGKQSLNYEPMINRSTPPAEVRALKLENDLRRELRIPIRKWYYHD